MRKNMGTVDRIARVIIATIIVTLYISGIIAQTFGVVLMVIAAVLILTSLIGFCPFYAPFGIKTCPRKK